MEYNENLFIKGFNDGYILAKFDFDLVHSILMSIKSMNSYFSGMTNGLIEYEIQQNRIHKLELDSIRSRNLDNPEIDRS